MKTERKSSLHWSNTDNPEIERLKQELERERKARESAENMLVLKMDELEKVSKKKKHSYEENPINNAFVDLIDPYVVMDMLTNVVNMNASAKEFLGYDHTKEQLQLSTLVHPDYYEYTAESFKNLLENGILRNYSAKIITKKGLEKYVNINASLIYNDTGQPIAAQGVIRDITEEVEIKKKLEDQKKQQDIIVENSSLGILLIVNDKIVKANRSFVELLGYSESELQKLSLNDISSLEDTDLYDNLLQKSLQDDSKKFSIVRKFHKKNGKKLYGKTSMSSVLDAEGNIEYNVAMIEDITKEKNAEKKIKASEERMATLIKNLQTGILLEDQDRKIVLANKKFCDLFGIAVSPDSLKGVNSERSIHKYKNMFLEPEESLHRINHVIDKKEVVTADEMELLDGRTFERDYIPLFNNGEYQGHLWSYNDVTLRKNYRRNLEVQKEKYGSIIANMNLGLVEVDNDENILLVNQSFSDMIGMSAGELIGENAKEVIHIIDEDREKLQLHNSKRLQGISDSYEVEVKVSNGEQRFWLISGAPRYDDAGNVIGSIGIHLDITTQKNLELQKENLLSELEASNKGLQEYAHIVSHDLKSPLRSISALSTWLYDDYKDTLDENGRYNLKMMQEKIEGMDKLITGILKYSTVNNDVLDNTEVNVNEVIQEIKEIIYIPDHVSIKPKKELPTIKADKTKIHQLFQNFLSNAVVNIDKKKGLVEIDYEEHPSHWEFSIKDNGVGIPKEYHEKIFQIFQSIGNKERSTGIGLSIVKKIIDRYSGKVWLKSKIGEGTTFFFTLKKEPKNKKR
ncbi:PAS domain-containing sensor histidine kinase [Flagellimonas myxillae]|uniref:PAS domain-containing sensor histidine kinase n=1 Tax=Flagellimonas myxillae TaxID=2942214 RepID=UPI00201F9DB1|nr:PAS domain-containing sensor histidine kinase [Muricauda myxillae]MCL6267148.1 PAS domain S-box protein [Muricauda myxillae]